MIDDDAMADRGTSVFIAVHGMALTAGFQVLCEVALHTGTTLQCGAGAVTGRQRRRLGRRACRLSG
ncbi:hypothetical protein [Streptomyces sp. NPDC005799]|uniref:hypothetical protein n=1 Tax=Streptomyces sp. NPDC005799 TaxID=3154678 RepID=UPI0033C390BE